jgi:hypothetical protein
MLCNSIMSQQTIVVDACETVKSMDANVLQVASAINSKDESKIQPTINTINNVVNTVETVDAIVEQSGLLPKCFPCLFKK